MLKIKQVNGLRLGQQMFDFLEWLHMEKGYSRGESWRCADIFYIPDEELQKLLEEYYEDCKL